MKKLLFSCCCCGIGNCCCGCCCDASSAPFPFPPPPGADALGDDGKLNSSISSSFYDDDDEEEEFSLLSVFFFGDVPTNGKMKKVERRSYLFFGSFAFFQPKKKVVLARHGEIFFSKNENGRKAAILVILGSHPPSLILHTHTISDLF